MPVSQHNPSLIIGVQLRKARELLSLRREEVAQELDVSPHEIKDWEKGTSQPSLQQLETLASLYGREIDYFLRETPNPPTAIAFRGKPGESLRSLSNETRAVLARFDELCRSAVEFEGLLHKKREIKLATIPARETARTGAHRIRKQYDLEDKPITDLRALLEDAGVRIFEIPIPNDELSGFSFWHEKYGPCILVHAKDVKGRRNFTLAHELAHLLYSHGSSACYIPQKIIEVHQRMEQKANQFAVELLLPITGVVDDFKKRNLPKKPSEKQLRQMSFKWRVSSQALGYRLEGLGLISAGLTNKMIERKPFLRRPKTPAWERRLGKRFVGTSIEAYRKNLISVGKLAHALQIPIRKAMEIAETGAR